MALSSNFAKLIIDCKPAVLMDQDKGTCWICMQILDTLVLSCPQMVSSRLAAKSWTHRFAHLAVTTTQASVRQAVLQLMANWAFQHTYVILLPVFIVVITSAWSIGAYSTEGILPFHRGWRGL